MLEIIHLSKDFISDEFRGKNPGVPEIKSENSISGIFNQEQT